MAKIGTLKQGDDNEVIYPQTVYSAVCDTDGTTLARDMSSVIHSQSVQSVEELPELLRDVKLNGTSIVTDGVANVPQASSSVLGVIKASRTRGLAVREADGLLYLVNPDSTDIQNRTKENYSGFGAINTGNIVMAVDSVLCSTAESEALTATQQSVARARLGVDFEYITTAEISEEISTVEVDLESDYKEIAMMLTVKPAEINTSNNGTLFIITKDSSGSRTIDNEVYVAYGVGGTSVCVAFVHVQKFENFTRVNSGKNANATYQFVQSNKSENLIRKIRFSGNNVRYFGVGSSIILYGKK